MAFMPEHVITADDQPNEPENRTFEPIAPCQFRSDGTFDSELASTLQGATWASLQTDVYAQSLGGHHICVLVSDNESPYVHVLQQVHQMLQDRFPVTTFVQRDFEYGIFQEMENFLHEAVATLGILFCTTDITQRCAHDMLNRPYKKCPCITVDFDSSTDPKSIVDHIVARIS
jgi:hypothetical protein